MEALRARLVQPVDGASLAVFRIVFGLIVCWETYRYLSKDWIERYWVEPAFRFSYHGFGWLEPLPGPVMHALWVGFGVAGVCIALGYRYRLSCAFFAIGFGYCFLLEASRYLNHFYLIALLAALLAVSPAHRVWSLDAWRERRSDPVSTASTVPTWALWLLRFQVAVVYVYGGLAKAQAAWLSGQPMRRWLAREGDAPLIGPMLTQEWAVTATVWGALLFDLLIVFAVLWRRTRVVALLAALGFHVINERMFSLGVFPYLAFAALLLFCPPGWPRWLAAKVRGREYRAMQLSGGSGQPARAGGWRRRLRLVAPGLAVAYVVAQLVLPLRHHLYPGESNWTEQGHTLAWHMKLRSKSGDVEFLAYDPTTGHAWHVNPLDTLEPWQYDKMAIRPEMMREFARHISREHSQDGRPQVQVYANAWAALNGRAPQPLVDSTVDLAAQDRTLAPLSWVLPLLPADRGQAQ